MKRRIGFVSNSSSASFIIDKNKITSLQAILIEQHDLVGTWLGVKYADTDMWDVTVDTDVIRLYTHMDNFDMEEFLCKIDVSNDAVLKDQERGIE